MTKEPKWTKGPWALSEGDNGTTRMIYSPVPNQDWGNRGIVISAGTKEIRGEVEYTYLAASDENLNLIAAAPELYGSLRNIMNGIETGMITVDSPADEQLAYALRQAKAALSKALGEKT